MAGRPRKRLNYVTFHEGDVQLELPDDAFDRLEKAYRRSIPEPARERMLFLCCQYTHWKRAGDTAETYADVELLFKRVKSAVEGFTPLAFGSLAPKTDAGGALAGMLADHLQSLLLQIPRAYLEIYDSASSDFVTIEPEGPPLRLRLNLSLVEHIAYSLVAAIDGVGKEIEDKKNDPDHLGIMPGDAFPGWLWTMRDWAKQNKFPAGPYSWDGYAEKRRPTTFAQFLFALNNLFPDGYREEVSSPMAMADRLKAAMQNRS